MRSRLHHLLTLNNEKPVDDMSFFEGTGPAYSEHPIAETF